jgi:hypothetical protein
MAKTVNLDPAPLASGGEAKLRNLVYTPPGGSATTVQALLSAAVTIPPAGLASGDLTQITVVTDVQWDASAKKFQKKTRTAYVYNPGTESAWTDVVAGKSYTV